MAAIGKIVQNNNTFRKEVFEIDDIGAPAIKIHWTGVASKV